MLYLKMPIAGYFLHLVKDQIWTHINKIYIS